MKDNNLIVLIDGFSQIFRGFHAVPDLENRRGEPINALLSFARFLLSIDDSLTPSHGAVVLDKGPPSQRLEIYPEYKANRPEVPEKLEVQIPAIKEWSTAAGWPVLEKEGAEADDIIAAISAARENYKVRIISADKDLAQLINNEEIIQLIPRKGKKLVRLGTEEIKGKYGIAPEQIVDYLAMLGDASDNVKGVQGIGEKTAASLLNEFGNIENILRNTANIQNKKIRETLEQAGDTLKRNRRLISLDRELPENWQSVDSIKRTAPDWERLIEIARDKQMNSLVKTLTDYRNQSRSPTLF